MTAFDAEWTRCLAWIEAALAPSLRTHGVDDVRAEIEAGRAHLWPGAACAIITEDWATPRLRILNVWLGGGDLEELTGPLADKIEFWAVREGYDRITIDGRAGWQRALRKRGYEVASITLAKELA